MYFWNYKLQETWLDKRLKSPISEHPSKVNMLKSFKQCARQHYYQTFFMTLKQIELENLSLSDILNLRTVC